MTTQGETLTELNYEQLKLREQFVKQNIKLIEYDVTKTITVETRTVVIKEDAWTVRGWGCY